MTYNLINNVVKTIDIIFMYLHLRPRIHATQVRKMYQPLGLP